MIGNGWWSTGITVAWRYAGGGEYGWAATVDYLDGGFCDDDASIARVSTEGTLRTRYAVRNISDSESALAVVIDVIKADTERLGIQWREPNLYYKHDGESENYPPPAGWREMLASQAARIGWPQPYGEPQDDDEERADTDCACGTGDSCPCEADGPDGLCACCRDGDHRGQCWHAAEEGQT